MSRTAWVGPDDGMLAWDGNGDTDISNDELSFVDFQPGATTDLEGLHAFDSDGDGQLTANDTEWGRFVVWQDADQDGVSDDDELYALADLDILAIGLESDRQQEEMDGSVIHGQASYQRGDGSSGIVADVEFAVADDSFLDDSDGTAFEVTAAVDVNATDPEPEGDPLDEAETAAVDSMAEQLINDMAAFEPPAGDNGSLGVTPVHGPVEPLSDIGTDQDIAAQGGG